jgi:7-carboxy-7-deazaguanine synthase
VYTLREIFFTLQGEGFHTGRPAVFARFSGCNLWSGHEKDRETAICRFCDTQFVGVGPDGGKFQTGDELAAAIASRWPAQARGGRPFVVCTGGEPLLQLDREAIDALHARGFEIAIETNGTQVAPQGIDWITVSPKAGAPFVLQKGSEIKLVFPQEGAEPRRFEHCDFAHFFLQPMDGPDRDKNTAAAALYCMANPRWRLSIQTHKILGIR